MRICYRDSIGVVTVEIDTTDGISFDGEYAYFTDANGKDCKVSTRNIIQINQEV